MSLPHSKNIFEYPARYQFGHPSAPCDGASCCTDTCIQMIVDYYKDEHYGLSYIRKIAQSKTSFNEDPCTGINHTEVLVALDYFRVKHYKVGWGANAEDVWKYVSTGPVIVGVYYGGYPTRNGRCGDNIAEISGRTDCGFKGAHAVLVIGKRYHRIGKYIHRDFYVRDPDHNSDTRPEQPDYDRITYGQLNRAMRKLVPNTRFSQTYIIYPTREK